jgi:hypothetical protein
MDWIERIFHISPDGGSGTTEVLLLFGALFAIAIIATGAWKLVNVRRRR